MYLIWRLQKFQAIKIWFTDQNSQPLEVEDFRKIF